MLKIVTSIIASTIRKSYPPHFMSLLLVLLAIPTLFLTFSTVSVFAQKEADLTKPFKKCRELGKEKRFLQTLASDNESFIAFTDQKKIVSINTQDFGEIWTSEISGKLEGNLILDKNEVFYITSFLDENQVIKTVVNSISTRTGLVNWQTTLQANAQIKTFDNDLIFIFEDNNTFEALQRNDGQIAWKITLAEQALSSEVLSEQQLAIISEKALLRVSTRTGEKLVEKPYSFQNSTVWTIDGTILTVGFINGEILAFDLAKDAKIWKMRVGGSISNLSSWKDFTLATSYDNFIYCFSKKNGKLIWKKRVGGRITAKPLIYSNFAVFINSGENIASILDIQNGKTINRLAIEEDNLFLRILNFTEDSILFHTLDGIYLFSSKNCQ